MKNIVEAGSNVVKAHLKHLQEHGQTDYLNQAIDYLKENNIEVPEYEEEATLACGCPGSMAQEVERSRLKSQEEVYTDLQC